jgi:hypothetical protein
MAGAVGRRSEIANAVLQQPLSATCPAGSAPPGLPRRGRLACPPHPGSGWKDKSRYSCIGHFPGRAASGLGDMGLSMGPLSGPLLVWLLTICLALPASARDRLPAGDRPAPNAAPSNGPAVLTGKERLGKKWMDEQRIDNCKVPIDKRGSRPRPSTCPKIPTG